MSWGSSRSRRLSVVVVVALTVLAIPVGFTLAQALPAAAKLTDTEITPTPPPILNLTDTPTETSSPTATPGATSEETPPESSGGGGNGSSDGQQLVVAGSSGVADGGESEACENAEHKTIQGAVNDASPGDTVVVCADTYPESVTVDTANLVIRTEGNVSIESPGEVAIQVTAPEVTIQGFNIRATTGIAVGGQNTIVRDNTIQPIGENGTGIFLSDGRDKQGNPNPKFAPATGGRVVNNTVNANDQTDIGIWVDADKTNVKNNTVTDSSTQQATATTAIISSGNKTVIRDNTVLYPNQREKSSGFRVDAPAGIQVGLSNQEKDRPNNRVPSAFHNWATQNLVQNNFVSSASGPGIWLREVATQTDVRKNTVTKAGLGVVVFSNDTVVRKNIVMDIGSVSDQGDGVVMIGDSFRVMRNTINQSSNGVNIVGNGTLVKNNVIQNNVGSGVHFSGVGGWRPTQGWSRVIGNQLTGNGLAGVFVRQYPEKVEKIEIHRNHIHNNGFPGVYNDNLDKRDGEWPIVNATHNYWGCGGPSTGLKDPYTDRVANGTGEEITAGDDPGVSNVHFDPFLEEASCPSQTPTPTATATATATTTPTPTPPPGGGGEGDGSDTGTGTGDGSGDGGGAGRGDGDSDGGDADNDEPSGTDSNDDSATNTVTSPPTPTATPTGTPSATPPSTPTPTPAVEPGFGVITWLLGVSTLLGLLAIRRREENHE